MYRIACKTILLGASLALAPAASAELQLGGSGGANTIQARFEAFSLCNQNAKAKGLDDSACDKEARALRQMIGGGNQTASSRSDSDSDSDEPRTYNAAVKKTVEK